jgi:hypothetical protein
VAGSCEHDNEPSTCINGQGMFMYICRPMYNLTVESVFHCESDYSENSRIVFCT